MTSQSQPTSPTYPPLDVPKPVADGVWIVDSGPLRAFGLPIPVRMTVIRLGRGDLFLHSPTRFDPGLRQALERFGRIRHLVAPDIAHWTFLREWQQHCPDTLTWAAPGLRDRAQVRNASVRIDRDLSDAVPVEWAADLDQVVVRGWQFTEVDFFHKATRTLVLTDLVQNFEAGRLPLLLRPAARLFGVVAPGGGTPLHLRLLLRARRREAAQAVAKLLEWAPERVIFSHGAWFERDGTAALRRALDWLPA